MVRSSSRRRSSRSSRTFAPPASSGRAGPAGVRTKSAPYRAATSKRAEMITRQLDSAGSHPATAPNPALSHPRQEAHVRDRPSKLVVPLMLMLGWGCGRGNPAPERTGDSGPTNSRTALTINVTAPLAAGLYHTCAIVNGGATCWGANYNGQLGNGTTTNSSVPVSVSGLTSGVVSIAAGGRHNCAIANGGARCWGDNSYGQLGNGTTTDRSVPVQVSGLTSGVQAIAAGLWHTSAIANGGAQSWGHNRYGQLGNTTKVNSSVPVQVSGLTSGVQATTAGLDHTCANVNGAARCWGYNALGQLGNSTTTNSSVPVQVAGLTGGVQAIADGGSHSCAMNGGIQCWGYNYYGQLGDGTSINRSVPVQAGSASLVCGQQPPPGPCAAEWVCNDTSQQWEPTPAPAGTLCRPSAGACDIAEYCDGISGTCPSDQLAPMDTLCRASAGECDVAEHCDGVAPTCPPDQLAPLYTVCRAAVGPCDAAETCTGIDVTCPPDVLKPAGASCSDGNLCNGEETCDGVGTCLAGTPSPIDDGDACTADSCDPVLGIKHDLIAGCMLPPPNDPTVAPDIASATAFLYSGTNPVQTGVVEGTIEPDRVAVIRGHVRDRNGNSVSGVTITILGHPEFGGTLTRADGMFDMAVNGGGVVTVDYRKDGYLASQRQIRTAWRNYVWAAEVVLVPFDPTVNTVAFGGSQMQVARESVVTDADGTRQATVLFPSGTQASMVILDGTTRVLATANVRATEYTVGADGPKSMPGP